MNDFKLLYSEFLANKEQEVHLTAHSHHFWPDVAKDGIIQAWEDSKLLVDNKWNKFFNQTVPLTRKLIARILSLKNPDQIAFAPNTHELLFRLLSCFFEQDRVRILTTDSEFHSFDRQIERLNEWDKFEVNKIQQESISFEENFILEAKNDYDLIFISHVFYNTGRMLTKTFLEELIAIKGSRTKLVLDGYHSYCALPFSLSPYENEIFFLAGSYKYAQSGEGLCFLTIPSSEKLRPLNTGWYAHFSSLENKSNKILYSEGGDGFWGSTQDMTPFYRFNAVWGAFQDLKISVESMHAHVQSLQDTFSAEFKPAQATLMNEQNPRGHFLSYQFKSLKLARYFEESLAKENIFVDRRNSTIRIGFAPYHDKEQIQMVLLKCQKYC